MGECQRRLVSELGAPIEAFSYPNGKPSDFNEFTRSALKHYGYRWAFGYSGGYCRPGQQDLLALPPLSCCQGWNTLS